MSDGIAFNENIPKYLYIYTDNVLKSCKFIYNRFVTIETFDQSDEGTWPDQQKNIDKDKDKDNDKDKYI